MEASNLAITAFSTRRSDAHPEERQAFIQVSNFTKRRRRQRSSCNWTVIFWMPGKSRFQSGEASGVVFPLADAPAGKLTAQLKYELGGTAKQDALAQDDVGYAALNDSKPGRVLVVSPGNVALEVALATERAGKLANIEFKKPEILTSEAYKRDADGGAYDLIIYDQCVPPTMPREYDVHRPAATGRGLARRQPTGGGRTAWG